MTPFSSLGRLLRRVWRWLTGADRKPSVWRLMADHFGKEALDTLQTHDKHFPGYDIASLSRALASFHAEGCLGFQEVGSVPAWTMRALLDSFKQFGGKSYRPDAFLYQRVPVDVEEEVSVVSKGLYLSVMAPGAGPRRARRSASVCPREESAPEERVPERIAVLLAVNSRGDYWDGMETNQVPSLGVLVSIACRSREVADRFFAELEERRKRLSIYRGKVIDPVLHNGGVFTIGFKAIKQVREEDLVLPEPVKRLIRDSIVGFYSHGELLEGLGIEMKRGILLHGPPGTGKTSISLYLAGLLPHFTICFVSGDRLLHPREICQMARYLQPAMVVFEDIDLVAMERDANGLATVLGELMNQIDGCEPTDQVLFVMNTNSLDRLEGAVRNRPGRVDQIIEVPLPDRPARQQLLATFARRVRLPRPEMGRVLDDTEGMSPAMLKEIVKRAVVSAVDRNGVAGKEVVLEEDDLLEASRQVQAMRDPIPVPGNLGFRPRRPDGPAGREAGAV